MEKNKRIFGVNIATLFPWSWGPWGFHASLALALSAGFDGLQILPMRGWGNICLTEEEKQRVIAMEDAWNGGKLRYALWREAAIIWHRKKGKSMGMEWERFPRLHDWLLFGSWVKSYEVMRNHINTFDLGQIVTYHIWNRNLPVEICPENATMFPEGPINYPPGIVLDTEHLTRCGRHGQPAIDWKKLLDRLDSNQVKFIHVKPHAPEVAELRKMLLALAELTHDSRCPIILEASPRILLFGRWEKTVSWLREERIALEGYFLC